VRTEQMPRQVHGSFYAQSQYSTLPLQQRPGHPSLQAGFPPQYGIDRQNQSMQYVSNKGQQNLRHKQAVNDLSAVFYPSDASSIGRHLEGQPDDSDDEISEMKSMVAVLR